jgi:hypothetical protein
MKITIEGHEINMGKIYGAEMYRKGGMICYVAPWESSGCPITLEICICSDGTILKRSWDWDGDANHYLHTKASKKDITVTPEMTDAVSGLFSGRILIDGVKISVGASVQEICPVDIKSEEAKTGNKIYIA